MLFHLENINCSYNSKDVVLAIPKISFDKGKIYFVLGSSGVGKSTFLELLGLMSDLTNKNTGATIHYQSPDFNILNLWRSDEKISEFRKKHYGFVFQNSYLMPNFTNYQNLIIGPLMQELNDDNLRDRVEAYCKKVKLPVEMLDRFPNQLSGGQKQRVSFLIAMLSDFDVIFGDEPTGNLDKNNAHQLMEFLSDEIKSKGKSAFIVSHDIPLAMKFADQIIAIDKQDNKGVISEENVYERTEDNNWKVGTSVMSVSDLNMRLEYIISK